MKTKTKVSIARLESKLSDAVIANSILAVIAQLIIVNLFFKHIGTYPFIALEAVILAVSLFTLGSGRKIFAATLLMTASMTAFALFLIWFSIQLLVTGLGNIAGVAIMDAFPFYIFYLNLISLLTHFSYVRQAKLTE